MIAAVPVFIFILASPLLFVPKTDMPKGPGAVTNVLNQAADALKQTPFGLNQTTFPSDQTTFPSDQMTLSSDQTAFSFNRTGKVVEKWAAFQGE